MHRCIFIIAAFCLMLVFTGCKFSSITSATPDTGATIIMSPGETQPFGVTVELGDFQRVQDFWTISNESTESTRTYPEAYYMEYKPDLESPGSHKVAYTVTDYYFKMLATNFLGIMLPMNRATRSWNVIVKGIEVLPETHISAVAGNSITYTATAYPTGSYVYAWFLDGVQVSTNAKYVFTPTQAQGGMHALKVTAVGEGESYTYSRQIIVPLAKTDNQNDWLFPGFCLGAAGGYYKADTITTEVSGNTAVDVDGSVDKLDEKGQVSWSILCGGSGFDSLYSVNPTADGGCITAGYSNSPVIGTTANQSDSVDGSLKTDGYIVKLDGDGNIAWQRLVGSAGSEYIRTIRQTSEGGYIALGSSDDVLWVVKLNASGGLVWERTVEGTYYFGYPYMSTPISDMIIESSGYYVLAGGGAVCKLNPSDGSTVWQIASSASCITPAVDGGYVVAGLDNGFSFAAKLGEDGTVAWQQSYTDDTDYLEITSISTRAGTGYMLGGTCNNQAMVLLLDKNGVVSKRIIFGQGLLQTSNVLMMPMADGTPLLSFRTTDPDTKLYVYFLVPVNIHND